MPFKHSRSRTAPIALKPSKALRRARRGPRPKPPELRFNGYSWEIYYRGKPRSLSLPKEKEAEAQKKLERFKQLIADGEEAREHPGEITFARMIKIQLAHMEAAIAGISSRLVSAKSRRSEARWLLRYFGKKKLIEYRKKDSELFQTWYVKQRKDWYQKRPWLRSHPANGAVVLLQRLKSFCIDYAENEEIGWYPIIKIPKGVPVVAGRILEGWEQERLLHACRGRIWDREANCWKTSIYTDANGQERLTYTMRPKAIVAARKGISRAIRAAFITGAREEVWSEVIWGPSKTKANFDVDDDGFGTFYRRGKQEHESNKPRPSSPVPDRLAFWLRIWKRMDGQSRRATERQRACGTKFKKHTHVIRQRTQEAYAGSIDIAGIVRDAGLDRDVTEHALRFTSVDEAYEQGMTLPAAAKLTGMSEDQLKARYTDWEKRDQGLNEDALAQANSKEARRRLKRARRPGQGSKRMRAHARDAANAATALKARQDG